MMDSRQREYNWDGICELIWADMGLKTRQEQVDANPGRSEAVPEVDGWPEKQTGSVTGQFQS